MSLDQMSSSGFRLASQLRMHTKKERTVQPVNHFQILRLLSLRSTLRSDTCLIKIA